MQKTPHSLAVAHTDGDGDRDVDDVEGRRREAVVAKLCNPFY